MATAKDTSSSRLSKLPIGSKPKGNGGIPTMFRMILAGPAKTGKSTMAATAEDPLFLDFEKGRLDHIEAARMSPLYLPEGVDLANLEYPFSVTLGTPKLQGKRYQFMIDWLKGVYSILMVEGAGAYKTLVWDTIDTMFALMLESYRMDGKGSRDQRQDFKAIYADLLPILRSYTNRLPLHQIYVAHVNEYLQDGSPKYVLAMPEGMREHVTHHVELIGMIYVPSAKGMPNRFFTKNRANWPTADGTGILNEEIPTTMQAIYAHWLGEDPEKYQATYTRFSATSDDESAN